MHRASWWLSRIAAAICIWSGAALAQAIAGVPDTGLFTLGPDDDGDEVPNLGVMLPDNADGVWRSAVYAGDLKRFGVGAFFPESMEGMLNNHIAGLNLGDIALEPAVPSGPRVSVYASGLITIDDVDDAFANLDFTPSSFNDPGPGGVHLFRDHPLAEIQAMGLPHDIIAPHWSQTETDLAAIEGCRTQPMQHRVFIWASAWDENWHVNRPGTPDLVAITWWRMFPQGCMPDFPTNTFQLLIMAEPGDGRRDARPISLAASRGRVVGG